MGFTCERTLRRLVINGKVVGCGNCPDKNICGGCRARAYSYFNGNVKAPDIGCIRNKLLWEKLRLNDDSSSAITIRR